MAENSKTAARRLDYIRGLAASVPYATDAGAVPFSIEPQARMRATEPTADTCRNLIEQAIMIAYVQLALKPKDAAGARSAVILHAGDLTFRLTEVLQPPQSDLPPLWLEALAGDLIIDSFGCFEFDGDELPTAVEFVRQAACERAERMGAPVSARRER